MSHVSLRRSLQTLLQLPKLPPLLWGKKSLPYSYPEECYLFSPTNYSYYSLSLHLFLQSWGTLNHMQKCLLVSAPESDGPNEQTKLETGEDSSNKQMSESLMKV